MCFLEPEPDTKSWAITEGSVSNQDILLTFPFVDSVIVVLKKVLLKFTTATFILRHILAYVH